MQLEGPPKTGPFSQTWINWLFNLYSFVSTGSLITVKDEGVQVGSGLTSLNFTGTGVTATATDGDVDVDISSGGGSTLGTLQNPSSVGQVVFPIPSGVSEIKIMFDQIRFVGIDSLWVRLGTSAGIETSGYQGGGTRVRNSGANSVFEQTAILIYRAANDENINGILHLDNMGGNTWAAAGSFFSSLSGTTGMITGSAKTLSDELTTIQLSGGLGDNFFEGAVNIKYI